MKKTIIIVTIMITFIIGILSGCTSEDYIVVGFENKKNMEIVIAYNIDDGRYKEYFYLDGNSDDILYSEDHKLKKGETHSINVSWSYSESEPAVNSASFIFNNDVIFVIHENNQITKI